MAKARGVVLESKNGYSTVLMEGGHYIRIRRTMEAGQIYQPENQYIKLLMAAAAILIFILITAVDFFNIVAYANVSNGIELGVNRWNRIVQVKHSEAITTPSPQYSALKGQKLQEAVPIVVKDAFSKESENQPEVTIQVNSEKKEDTKLEQEILQTIETSVKKDFVVPEQKNGTENNKQQNSIKIKQKQDVYKNDNSKRGNNQSKMEPDQGRTDYPVKFSNEINEPVEQKAIRDRNTGNSKNSGKP